MVAALGTTSSVAPYTPYAEVINGCRIEPNARCSGSDLSFADLTGADLSGADLSGANLNLAQLLGANLSGADLSGAILTGANLTSTNLLGANLRGARASAAKWGRLTTCPDGSYTADGSYTPMNPRCGF